MPGTDVTANLSAVKSALEKELEDESMGCRDWFPVYMGAGTYDDLVGMFDPSKHDAAWEAAKAEIDAGEGDVAARNADERAVCYLAAARRDVRLRYLDTEVSSMVRAKAPIRHWLNDEAELEMYFKKPSGGGK